MHSWYAKLLSSGFPGKMFTMYVHEPSLLTVVCHGKTIKTSWPQFSGRLEALLRRYHFDEAFIEAEMREADGYVTAKTNSAPMLGYMNHMSLQLNHHCYDFPDYDSISLDLLEDRMMNYLFLSGKKYTTTLGYWQKEGKVAG